MKVRKLKILLFFVGLAMLGCLETNPKDNEEAIAQAREYVTQINNLGQSARLGHRTPSKIGGVLTGRDADAYNQFSAQIDRASVIGDELDNVLEALIQGGLAFSSFLLGDVTGRTVFLPPPDGISPDGFNVVRGGTPLNPTRTFQFNFTGPVKVCEGELASCEVNLSVDIELDFPTSQPTGYSENSQVLFRFQKMNLTVNTLSASNQFVSIELGAGPDVLTSDYLAVGFSASSWLDLFVPATIESIIIASQGKKADLSVTIRDLQSYGAELEIDLVPDIGMLHLVFDMLSDDKSLELHSLDNMAFYGRTHLFSTLGSLITDFSIVGDTVGLGPFKYIFSDYVAREGEDPENYLKIDTNISRAAVIGGADLIESHVERNRISDTKVNVKNYTLRAGDVTYHVEVDLNLDGDIVNFEGEDPVSETQISVSSSGGTTSGMVMSGLTQLGTVTRNAEGALIITYTDGTTQPLQWAVDETGPADYIP